MSEDGSTDDVRITDARIEAGYEDAGTIVCPPPTSLNPGALAGGTYGPVSIPPACGALCGNGIRDTCGNDAGFNAGGFTMREDCDALDLGGQTCVSLGFAGGSLACDSTCHLDTAACQTCAPTSSGGAGCQPLVNQTWGVGLAASATEIGLARVEHNASCSGIRFDRYRPDLVQIAESACIGPCDANWVSLAATPSGWLLAIATTHGIDLLPLDLQGIPSGPIRTIRPMTTIIGLIGTPATPVTVFDPVLAPRGSGGTVTGGPLLMWHDMSTMASGSSDAEMFAVLLRDDGSEEQAPVRAFSSTNGDPGSAVFVGDGFLLAAFEDILPGPWFYGSSVRRLWLDGSLGVEHRLCNSGTQPQLAWTGTEARLTFEGASWVRLDANGAALESTHPTVMASIRSPVGMLGGDMVVLTGNQDMLEVVHVASDGTFATPTVLSPSSGFASVGLQQLVVGGTAVYAAWLACTGIAGRCARRPWFGGPRGPRSSPLV